MNGPWLESYCNVLYEFFCSHVFFAGVSSFSVISRNIALWRHSMSFDPIPQDAQNHIRNWCSHVDACSYKVW